MKFWRIIINVFLQQAEQAMKTPPPVVAEVPPVETPDQSTPVTKAFYFIYQTIFIYILRCLWVFFKENVYAVAPVFTILSYTGK